MLLVLEGNQTPRLGTAVDPDNAAQDKKFFGRIYALQAIWSSIVVGKQLATRDLMYVGQ